MRNNITAALLIVAAGLTAGCDEPFEHQRMGRNSEQFAGVNKMLQQLRDAGEGGFDAVFAEQVASDLDDGRKRMLRATLEQAVRADSMELQRVDEFGDGIFRATLKLSSGNTSGSAALLLIVGDGRMYWMGKN